MDRGSYNRPTAAALMIFLLWRLPGQGASPCPQAIFSFGDSLTDTGNAISNKPFTHSTQRALQAPYGSTYFGRPSNRFSDGRLLVDFIAKAFGYPFLAPYLGGAGADYRRGANFAYCGAEGRDGSNLAVNDLPVQVKQFQYLKTNVLAKFSESEGAEGLERLLLPSPDDFSTALYYIFIGINDFFHGYTQHQAMTPSEQNETVVPYLISSVSDAIQGSYNAESVRLRGKNVCYCECSSVGMHPRYAWHCSQSQYQRLSGFFWVLGLSELCYTKLQPPATAADSGHYEEHNIVCRNNRGV